MPQDTGFSSLFLKVLMQILQWLDSPAVEGGPLQAQLKLFAAQYSARRRITDGEGLERGASTRGCGLGFLPSSGTMTALLAQRSLLALGGLQALGWHP